MVITLMLWMVFFMSLLSIYLLSSWMPVLLNYRGIDLQKASWVIAAFQVGGTLGVVLLRVLIEWLNPFRLLAELWAGRGLYRHDKPERKWSLADDTGDFFVPVSVLVLPKWGLMP